MVLRTDIWSSNNTAILKMMVKKLYAELEVVSFWNMLFPLYLDVSWCEIGRAHGWLKIANIYEDIGVLKEAQNVAQSIMEKDNFLDNNLLLKEEVEKRFLNKLKEDIVLN